MAKGESAWLRQLPSVTEADRHLRALGLAHGKAVRPIVAEVLARFRERARHAGGNGAGHAERLREAQTALPAGAGLREAVLDAIAAAVRRPAGGPLRRVINATGVVVHTNLGRAPLQAAEVREVADLLGGYVNLEFDIEAGQRGERGGRVPRLLATLAEAEAGLAVNNNAAAVLLMLSALASGREVIVSRGELVEIGGGFRVPDILRQSGARLVEVGTTNRTRLSDYASAVTPGTAALLKVHRSNFALTGFVEETSTRELAALAKERGLAVWHDWGSGSLYRFSQPGLHSHTTAADEIRAGADVVTFSGDKLLGSVQAGLAVGKAAPLKAMAQHPLYRSLRVDKVRLALLEQALLRYLDIGTLRQHNVTVDLLERTVAEMEPLGRTLLAELGAPLAAPGTELLAPRGGAVFGPRASARPARRQRPAAAPGQVGWELVREASLAGGGAAPEARIDTLCLALTHPAADASVLAARLRAGDPPIVARIQDDRVLLDLRTLLPADVPDVVRQVRALGS